MQSPQLLFQADRLGAAIGAGGFAADIDDVGPFLD
jgi:hypothetical protein